ncbi:MAG TPA: M1 family aminopeptidase [Rhizomicrobium sp.]|nr:M1 family aminopeptidase [Rhizomicrobium sp.]
MHKGISLGGESVPLGKLPRDAVPERYRVALRIDPRADRFTGHVEIDMRLLKPQRSLFLHGLGLNVSGVTVRLKTGKSIVAHYDQVDRSGVARLIFVDRVPAGKATLIFDYDAPFNRSLDGLYKVVERGDSYAFTQFESTDARRAFPSFDEPGFKTPFNLTVVAPKGMRVIGNTPIFAAASISHGMTETVFQTTKPLPTYLIALAVGPLDVVDGGVAPPDRYRSRPLHIRGITARGNGPRIAYALSLTPKIIVALENYFGIGYPFQKLDILAVPDFTAGAMENAGAVTFRERYLLDADASLDLERSSLAVQSHELSHQWFGDLVTPAWWDDIWLNESFADWMEYKAAAAVMPELDFSTDTLRGGLDVMDLDELPSARQIHQPIANVDDLANVFDSITYDKGASVLRMFENYVGPDNWQRGIHVYLTKFAHRNATAKDFIGTIAATTGHLEIIPAFDSFIDQPGMPFLKVGGSCTGLDFAQSVYAPYGLSSPARSWRVPVCVMDGATRVCKIGTGPRFELPLTAPCTIPPLPNAEGGGYYHFGFDEADWQKQIALAPKMGVADQITLLANVFAGLRNGHAHAADAFALVRALAPTARWDVLRSLTKPLLMVRQSLSPNDLPAYRAFLSRNFLPRFKTMGVSAKNGEKPADAFAREYLAVILVTEAHDPDAIAMLSGPIEVSAQSGEGKWRQLAPDVRPEALRAALLTDKRYADDLVAVFQSTNDEAVRRDIVYAFAGNDDPAVVGKLLALAPAKMRIGELRYLTEYMPDETVARTALWTYVSQHYDAFARLLSPQGMGNMGTILKGACEPSSHADAEAFFEQKMGGALGARRRVAHTEEQIDRCVALRQNAGADIASALASAK